ncbi:MAG: hypothetical protein ACRCSI_01770, partial [Eubacterium aggregans]
MEEIKVAACYTLANLNRFESIVPYAVGNSWLVFVSSSITGNIERLVSAEVYTGMGKDEEPLHASFSLITTPEHFLDTMGVLLAPLPLSLMTEVLHSSILAHMFADPQDPPAIDIAVGRTAEFAYARVCSSSFPIADEFLDCPSPFVFRGYPVVAMPFSTDLAKHQLCTFDHRRFLGPFSGHEVDILTSSQHILAVFPVTIRRNQHCPPAFKVVFQDINIPDHLIVNSD